MVKNTLIRLAFRYLRSVTVLGSLTLATTNGTTISSASAQTLPYAIFFDTATIGPKTNDYKNYYLIENESPYYAASNGTYNAPYRFSTGAYAGMSLDISVPTTPSGPAPDGKTTDRFEYEWVQYNDPNAPSFNGQERYFGFAFKIIGNQSAAPTNGGIIMAQFWQGGSSSTPYAPPIRMDVIAPSVKGKPWPNRLFIQKSSTGQGTGD